MERDELIRYLDRVQGNYPLGIPKSALAQVARSPATGSALCRVLFVVGSASTALSAVESELLQSIVVKGLSLPASSCEVEVLCLTTATPTVEAVEVLVTAKRPEIVIGLGLGLGPRGSWSECAKAPILHTVLLAEIASSQEAKREFWGHLKGALIRLAPVSGD